jgi:hypothetical protein
MSRERLKAALNAWMAVIPQKSVAIITLAIVAGCAKRHPAVIACKSCEIVPIEVGTIARSETVFDFIARRSVVF